MTELPAYFKEVAVALAPIAVLFALFQLVTRRFKKKKRRVSGEKTPCVEQRIYEGKILQSRLLMEIFTAVTNPEKIREEYGQTPQEFCLSVTGDMEMGGIT